MTVYTIKNNQIKKGQFTTLSQKQFIEKFNQITQNGKITITNCNGYFVIEKTVKSDNIKYVIGS